jgi:hypothetical protein
VAIDQGEFGGDLDAAAAFGVEAGVEHVGADVLAAPFHEREMGNAAIEGSESQLKRGWRGSGVSMAAYGRPEGFDRLKFGLPRADYPIY